MQQATRALALVPQSGHQNDNLEARARVLWPRSEHYQQQWVASIRFLRDGRGWVLEGARTDWHALPH